MEFGSPVFELIPLLAIGYRELPWYGNALIALWLWLFGANVGSFMNVVVFRLPAGKSIVSPRSRCPNCEAAIRWFDNVPVLSWIWLRARCRRCGIAISSRYPTVEAIVAIVFVTLAFLSPMTSGASLPEIVIELPLRLQTMDSLWLMYAFHLLMICTLICSALIKYDRLEPPYRLFFPAVTIGLVAPLVWTELHPIPFAAPIDFSDRGIALLDSLVGGAVGAALALVHTSLWGRMKRYRPADWPEIASAALVGLYLGWQAAALILVVAEGQYSLTLRLSHRQRWLGRLPWIAHLVFVALIYIILWRSIYEMLPWLGRSATIASFAVSFLAMAFLSWFSAALLEPKPPTLNADELPPAKSQPSGVHEMTSSDDAQINAITDSHSYQLAERDIDFLSRPELRPIRLQLELLKPEMILAEQNVHSTIVAFGGTQIVERHEAEERLENARLALAEDSANSKKQRQVSRAERVLAKSKYYDAARDFAKLVASQCHANEQCDFVIATGGGPGIMEAANRGAHDVGAKSIGFNITLPDEQAPNRYITPELCFQFHYFALRKMHFLFRAKALVAFPGGFGTLDELFCTLTLRQTNRMQEIPIVLFGKDYWDRVLDLQFLADEGTIRDEHLDLIQYAETPAEAWEIISSFHSFS